jgi:hypothetical protein
MSHLPKFVRERLKASVSPIGHPDPDVLTAFSERSLPAHERAVVMEHLARCGECRDIVALALPATEAVLEPARAAHRDWFRWPVLRWGAVAAGIVVIAAIGIRQYREGHEPLAAFMARNQTAKNTATQDQVARNEVPRAETRTPSPEAQPARPSAREEAIAAGGAPAASTEARSSSGEGAALLRPPGFDRAKEGSAAGGVIGGPIQGAAGAGRNEFRTGQGTEPAVNVPSKNPFNPTPQSAPGTQTRQLPPPAPAQNALVPSMSETVEVQSAAPAVTAQDQSQDQRQDQRQIQGKDQQLDLYQAQQLANAERVSVESDKTLRKAKPATPEEEVDLPRAPAPAQSPQSVLTARNVVPLPAPTWTITSTGRLQRSFDSGRTWQVVSVPVYPATVSGYMRSNESVAVYAPAGSEKKQKKDAKSAKQSNAAPIFRAVAANGLDVWAGGSAGALYHSIDAGDHWTRIFPLAGSVLLTADIASIQFSDLQNGTITTTTSEVWTTTDAGRSWQKH